VPRLRGRQAECEALNQLLAEARAGHSVAVVLRGEAGVGKSALLRFVSERVAGWHVASAEGVESEMELAYSSLHQLCAAMLDHLDRLPEPQRDALAIVFGQETGPVPDRFLVGLATLTLFAEVAEEKPLVCIVDDAQWLDAASAQIIGFVGRRLLAERIALVCAARSDTGYDVLAGLQDMPVRGLGDTDARALLLENVHGPLDAAVCEQIITESHGNPLALLELPRTWNVAELAGGFGLPGSQHVARKIEESYARRLVLLPSETQLLLLAASAEPLGDPVLLHRAAAALGIEVAAAGPAQDAGLLTVGGRVEFVHPLIRSAAYHAAPAEDRRRTHRALAEATDPERDPDRRAWHLACATAGPDEGAAAELEWSASRAQARGGRAAAAAFLQRAVALTADPGRRTERALRAAEASLQAGSFEEALALAARAEAGPVDEYLLARIDLLRGHVAFASGLGNEVPLLLLGAGRRLEPFDAELARQTYLTAWLAANHAGPAADGVRQEISRAIRTLGVAGPTRPHHILLDGLALLTTDGLAAAAPTLRRAVDACVDMADEEVLRWGIAATAAAAAVWDHEGLFATSSRLVELVREAGALAELPLHLYSLGVAITWKGDFAGAAALAAETASVATATDSQFPPFTLLRLRSLQGREAETSSLIAEVIRETESAGESTSAIPAYWAACVLYNGLGRYGEAVSAAKRATLNSLDPWVPEWARAELVEAAAGSGDNALARDALERLSETTQSCGNDFALGIEGRCRALLADGAAADELYRDAIDRLGRSQLRPELARAHLVYGEWLRREGRGLDAREQLGIADDMFAALGMEAFGERARRELAAAGQKARKRLPEIRDQLTPQEEQIARLARDGLSNREIGALLFLSPRTVEWHLRKVFAKFGIDSRSGLRTSLTTPEREATLT
jgi:DNA-binding CsgD family transcriptional regulator